jgi:hypothetical protein
MNPMSPINTLSQYKTLTGSCDAPTNRVGSINVTKVLYNELKKANSVLAREVN